MDRRQFLKSSGAALALGGLGPYAAGAMDEKRRRVGLIGCGWYGKIDLFRLIQVSPVEVVSLCDVDRNMLAQAADMVASRQQSKKKPRTYSDFRKMLAERDLDIVLIAPPDHWHALIMIEAVRSGADIYVQKPISRDVLEAKAMYEAARQHGRVVQVGLQRRSTPHLVEAKQRFLDTGQLGKIGLVEIYCYYHMRATENPPDTAPPEYLDYEMWTGPAPMRPYNRLVHPRGWRAFMEYGNGIIGDMCVHMLDMTRWMLGLGWPARVSSTGGIFIDQASKANITDTQTATFDFPNLRVVWQHRSYGEPADPKYPWGATFYGEKGTLKTSVYSYDYIPLGSTGQAVHRDVTYEFDKYPEDRTEKDLETHVAPAERYHMLNLLHAIDTRGRPVSDIEEGYISTASCILANNSLQLGRTMEWDPQQVRVKHDEEANKLLARKYRGPWTHPATA
ncbi:MAG TPA: Gfo/Idh/MocA family oxidoreductase [Bryobacteraceae bacterium]|jgi:predicted dehydrogenase|nr:Gfo/Idh/MocA family oxidoreductase [Bryobacteraceae bacterium]